MQFKPRTSARVLDLNIPEYQSFKILETFQNLHTAPQSSATCALLLRVAQYEIQSPEKAATAA
jgi:hypothetical protein